MITPDYQPIDWHSDFKSGYRWPELVWYEHVVVVGIPGVDIKVPWELARMQHLCLLARAISAPVAPMSDRSQRCVREIRDQILDFIAQNPCKRGPNWASPMDISIRAVNWIVALELCRVNGIEFDLEFHRVVDASLREHARHITRNLEWTPEFRGNHFLASVLGVLFVASYVARTVETEMWLTWAVHQLRIETMCQFNDDGSNVECSTGYHRLSAEIVLLATALVLGLNDKCLATIRDRTGYISRLTGRIVTRRCNDIPPRSVAAFLRPVHFERLRGIAQFSSAITKPNGKAVLIGDNDSGRILKIDPRFEAMSVAEARRCYRNLSDYRARPDDACHLEEDLSSHADVIAGISALFGGQPSGIPDDPITSLVNSLGRGCSVESPPIMADLPSLAIGDASTWAKYVGIANSIGPELRCEFTVEIRGGIPVELTRSCFPDFGIFVFRARDFYLAIKCGPQVYRGNGAHAHNDQLAVELQVAGTDILRDPGSYCYTPFPKLRDAYRSASAHSGPRVRNREPNNLNEGMFTLVDRSAPRCLYFGQNGFIGTHCGYGTAVHRIIAAHPRTSQVRIIDFFLDAEDARHLGLSFEQIVSAVPFAPAYGVACNAQ
jgi:hypothetical protein